MLCSSHRTKVQRTRWTPVEDGVRTLKVYSLRVHIERRMEERGTSIVKTRGGPHISCDVALPAKIDVMRAGVDNTLSTEPHSSIAVVFRLERAVNLDTNMNCMFMGKDGAHRTECRKVQCRNCWVFLN